MCNKEVDKYSLGEEERENDHWDSLFPCWDLLENNIQDTVQWWIQLHQPVATVC